MNASLEPFEKCWFCRELIGLVKEHFNQDRADEVSEAMRAYHAKMDPKATAPSSERGSGEIVELHESRCFIDHVATFTITGELLDGGGFAWKGPLWCSSKVPS